MLMHSIMDLLTDDDKTSSSTDLRSTAAGVDYSQDLNKSLYLQNKKSPRRRRRCLNTTMSE